MPKQYCTDCWCEADNHTKCRKCGVSLCKVCSKRQDKLCEVCCSEEDNGYLLANMDNDYVGYS